VEIPSLYAKANGKDKILKTIQYSLNVNWFLKTVRGK